MKAQCSKDKARSLFCKLIPRQREFLCASRLLFLMALLMMTADLRAQVTTGVISGTVSDATGAVVPGATVRITHVETGISRALTTDEAGRFYAAALPVGQYEIRVERSGFAAEVRRGITLVVGQEAVVDFALRVGAATEMVEVTGDVPQVQTTSAALSYLVDDKKIRDLPLNGRSFTQLALLQPGVQTFKYERTGFFGGRGQKISVSGARPTSNTFLLDGTNANDLYNRTPGSSSGVFLGVDTVREFSVITNSYSAEYGRAAGGVINAVTKSGTNELHGSIFEFLRNSALDARNFFDQGPSPPPFKRSQFGGTLGGPIKNGKSFFFGAYEGLRQRLANTRIVNVPTLAQRAAAVPAVIPYINLFPRPNVGAGQFSFAFSEPTNEDFFQVRVDHVLSPRHSLFVRYTFDDARVIRSETYPLFAETEPSRNQYTTIEEKALLTHNLFNTLRFAFNRTNARVQDQPFPGASIDPSLSFISGQPFGDIVIGGVTPSGSQFGTEPRVPIVALQNLFEVTDDLVLTKGRHAFKLGGLLDRYQWNDVQDSFRFGEYLFANITAFLQGTPGLTGRFTGTLPSSVADRANRSWLFGVYFQDDFRATSRLSLNLGLRYETITVPSDARGRDFNLRNILTDTQTTQGPLFRNPSRRNFGPRIGFAWDPWGNGKTAIRAGFGIFYDQILEYALPTTRFQTPLFFTVALTNPKFPNPGPLTAPPTPNLSLQVVDFNIANPHSLHYSFTIQRELFRDTALSVGYAGLRGINLLRGGSLNLRRPTIQPDGSLSFPVDAKRINPAWSDIDFKRADGNSWYNALQVSANRRFSRGLQFQASYTWSRNIDEGSGLFFSDTSNSVSDAQNPFDRKRERGLSNLQVKHNFVLNYTYDIPTGNYSGKAKKLIAGWQLNGILTLASGNPFTAAIVGDRAGALLRRPGQERPNQIADPFTPGPVAANPDIHCQVTISQTIFNPVTGKNEPGRAADQVRTAQTWFNPCAFGLQPAAAFGNPGTFGNLGRNTLIGPDLKNFDFALTKNTAIRERWTVQFRTEIFNIFNHPNFATPDASVFAGTDPATILTTAGKIFPPTVSTSRQIQFGLKIMF